MGDPTVTVGKPGTGGFNQTVKELVESLKDSSLNIVIITNKSKDRNKDFISISSNVTVYFIDFDTYWESHQDLLVDNFDTILKRVSNIIELISNKAKICLIHSFYWLSGIIAVNLKRKFNIPFIHTVISLAENKLSVGVSPHTSAQRRIEDDFLPESELIFAITPQEKNILVNTYRVDSKKIVIVGRSVSKEFFRAFNEKSCLQEYNREVEIILSSNDNSWWINGAFLYVGRITPTKGIEQIVRAWVYANERNGLDIPLWFIGGTPQQILKMREQIGANGLSLVKYEKSNKIIWWGNLSSVGISTLMRKAKALIMHSQFEAGGRVIIEALTAGIPVIATPYGFGSDYIYDGYNGFVTEFNDIIKLSNCMLRFSEQPYLSSVMGNCAHNFMNEIYLSWDYLNKHLQIYNAFLTDGSCLNIPSDLDIKPKNLNSFKARHSVLCFPFFNTERNTSELSEILSKEIGDNSITQMYDDNFHADIYSVQKGGDEYVLKSFYHILSSMFLKLQHKNVDVLSAQEQIVKAINSTKYNNIANLFIGDIPNLFYIIPRFKREDDIGNIQVLIELWKESLPDNNLIKLYNTKNNLNYLKEAISKSKSSLINYLFCAEIACEYLFSKVELPCREKEKIRKLIEVSTPVWGLNYGKSILGHIVKINENVKLLPSHGIYLGELGCDIALTFMSLKCDDIEVWNELKRKQNIVSSERLDLWLIFAIYSNDEEHFYPRTLSALLNL